MKLLVHVETGKCADTAHRRTRIGEKLGVTQRHLPLGRQFEQVFQSDLVRTPPLKCGDFLQRCTAQSLPARREQHRPWALPSWQLWIHDPPSRTPSFDNAAYVFPWIAPQQHEARIREQRIEERYAQSVLGRFLEEAERLAIDARRAVAIAQFRSQFAFDMSANRSIDVLSGESVGSDSWSPGPQLRQPLNQPMRLSAETVEARHLSQGLEEQCTSGSRGGHDEQRPMKFGRSLLRRSHRRRQRSGLFRQSAIDILRRRAFRGMESIKQHSWVKDFRRRKADTGYARQRRLLAQFGDCPLAQALKLRPTFPRLSEARP